MSDSKQDAKAGGVEAVDRALTILNAFDASGKSSLSLHELAEITGFYKSTILRLAASLERFAYLRRKDDGRFQLGPACARLAALQSAAVDKGELLQHAVKFLAQHSGETSSYYVREGTGRVCVFRENSARAVRHHVEIGDRLPLDRGAAGLALLAFAGEKGRRFDTIRAEGMSVSIGEREPDAAGISAPVFDADGTVLGALTISGVVTRFTPEAVAGFSAVMRQAVADLDREFGVPVGVRGAAAPAPAAAKASAIRPPAKASKT